MIVTFVTRLEELRQDKEGTVVMISKVFGLSAAERSKLSSLVAGQEDIVVAMAKAEVNEDGVVDAVNDYNAPPEPEPEPE